jgi:hypothetical protein
LQYDKAQWICIWSLGKSDAASDMYSSQDVMNVWPFDWSLLKLSRVPSPICEGCEVLETVVIDSMIGAKTTGGGATSLPPFCSVSRIVVLMFHLLYGWPPLSQTAISQSPGVCWHPLWGGWQCFEFFGGGAKVTEW